MNTNVKKNDIVQVITGKFKGKKGKIMKLDSDRGTVVVEKLNLRKRHMKPTQTSPQGGMVEKEAPIAVSNVLLFCKKCEKGVRISIKIHEDGTKSRICKKCGEIF